MDNTKIKKGNDSEAESEIKLKFDKAILKDKMKVMTASLNKKITKNKFFQIKANNRVRVKK
ncbi:MAG: hypothetical protein PHN88_01270 [Ignavibacteria bacterium]|nr:hypothetical protein [Ignavibacteria bacterium]